MLLLEGSCHCGAARFAVRSHTPQQHSCQTCGGALFVTDPRWPEWVYPFASAIDTPLPVPPERAHIMLAHKAPWVGVPEGRGEIHFSGYPDGSIADWHRRHGVYLE